MADMAMLHLDHTGLMATTMESTAMLPPTLELRLPSEAMEPPPLLEHTSPMAMLPAEDTLLTLMEQSTLPRERLMLSQRLMLRLSMDTTPTLPSDQPTTMVTLPMLPQPTEAMLPLPMATPAMLPQPTTMDTPETFTERGLLMLSQRLKLMLMPTMDTLPMLLPPTDTTLTLPQLMDTLPMLPPPTEAMLPLPMATPAMLPQPTTMDTQETSMARGLLMLSQKLMLRPYMEDMDTPAMLLLSTTTMDTPDTSTK